MAASVPKAIIDLYTSISAATFGGADRPPIYMGEAAQTTGAGAQLRPPYVVLYDDGFRPEFDSSAGGIERGEIKIEVFALPLDAASGTVSVGSILRAIKWGGSTPAAKAGLDFGAYTLTGFNYKIETRRTKEQTSYAGFDYQGQRVHKGELAYALIIGLSPT